jgi:hypothetical protein
MNFTFTIIMKRIYLIILLIAYLPILTIGQNSGSTSFFPIAVWLQSAENAKVYKQDGGINMYVGLWNELDEKQFHLLKSAGIKLICQQNEFGLAHKSDPIIFGWMHGDEPDNAQWNNETKTYDPCINPAQIIDDYSKIKEKDPDHPIYLNLGQGVSYTNYIGRGECRGKTDLYKVTNNGYLKGCDIASFDIYPVNNNHPDVQDKLWMVAKGIDSLRVWCNDSKPVWTWIETTRIGEDSPRKPTPKEVKEEVWMAIIHGAKGIGYFCHSFYPQSDESALLHDSVMLAEVKEINQQITTLATVLNSNSTSDIAAVKSSNSNVPIDMLAKKQENANYLFTVAMRNEPTDATFTIKSGSSAEVIGENRRIKITNGQFKDHFNGYEVHLYKISADGTAR